MILGVQESRHNFRSKLLKFRSGWQLCCNLPLGFVNRLWSTVHIALKYNDNGLILKVFNLLYFYTQCTHCCA